MGRGCVIASGKGAWFLIISLTFLTNISSSIFDSFARFEPKDPEMNKFGIVLYVLRLLLTGFKSFFTSSLKMFFEIAPTFYQFVPFLFQNVKFCDPRI